MKSFATILTTAASFAALAIMLAACADDQHQSLQQPLAPATRTAANAATTVPPAMAAPPTAPQPGTVAEPVPVPAYGPAPHAQYFYPPVGFSTPGAFR